MKNMKKLLVLQVLSGIGLCLLLFTAGCGTSGGGGGAGTLARFSVTLESGDSIPGQGVGIPFSIRIVAQDSGGNTVTDFDGPGNTVDISDSTGTIAPGVSGAFTNGVCVESVTVSQMGAAVTITVTDTAGTGLGSGTESGSSNRFDVAAGGYAIDVDVSTVLSSVEDSAVHVTSFTNGGALPDDEIETVDFPAINSGSSSGTLDNNGLNYPDGTYELRAHIDISSDGFTPTTNNDYICLGQATVSDANTSVTLSGPWGGYATFSVTSAYPSGVSEGETVYLIVVSQGDTWGNYAFGNHTANTSDGFIAVDMWAPDGTYDLLALVDIDGDFAVTGAPDSGDFEYQGTVTVTGGSATELTINSGDWTSVP